MPKLDNAAFGNGSATKTLIDEYANTFSGKKIVVASNRRTLSHISMDIINQRIENLNKNASLQRLTINDAMDPQHGDTDANNIDCDPSPVKPLEPLINGTPNGEKPKPLKRKLFAPPSMFSPVDLTPTLKTDTPPNKSTKSAIKRNRDALLSPLALKSTPLSSAASKKPNEKRVKKIANDVDNNNAIAAKKATATKYKRRSTMLFQSAEKVKPKNERTAAVATTSTESLTPKSVMVFTNMHKQQVDAIKEVCWNQLKAQKLPQSSSKYAYPAVTI